MRNSLLMGAIAALLASALSLTLQAAGGRLLVRVGGDTLRRVRSIVIDSDTSSPDAATIVLQLPGPLPKLGDAVEVSASEAGLNEKMFTGEVTAVNVQASDPSRVILRAFNRLHRLTRGRRQRSFEKRTDGDLARQLAGEAGLTSVVTGYEANITHDQVHQHNQTDLEFLLERASRIGYEILVDGSTLYFQKRGDTAPVWVGCRPYETRLMTFHPRLSSSAQVSAVTVRGWDPDRKVEIVGRAGRSVIPLSPGGEKILSPQGAIVDLGFVQPLQSGDASHGAAIGTLLALTAGDVAGEADTEGDTSLRAGAVVSLAHVDRRFEGKYHVVAVSHRLNRLTNERWHTLLRLTRTDRGVYVLPEIGDEVLVAFENGDISRPFVVGSLWDEGDRPPESSPCDPRRRR